MRCIMHIKKGLNVAIVGSMITFATFSAFPIHHASAEESLTTESTTRLSALEILEFELDQTFSKDVTTYTATVSNDTNSMSLLLDTEIVGTLVTVNGEEVTSKEQLSYSLNTGENIFTITLLNGSQVTTYTLTIFRALNENSNLSNLTLSSGTLNFSPSITSYSVAVENSISSITIKPETSVDTSTVNVEGTTVDPQKGHTIELPVGKTTVSFVVKAENGNQSTYTVTITRAAMVSNSIDTNTTDNTKTNTNQTTTTTSQPTMTNLVSTAQTSSGSTRSSSTVQGTSTSSTGAQTETPTTANLSALTVSSGTWNKAFDSDTYTYHIAVGTDVTSVTIAATTDESEAEVEIEGSTNTTVALPDQAKTAISVSVTNGDDRKTYVLVFDKEIEEVENTETSNTVETTEASVSSTTNSTVAQSNMSGDPRGQNKQAMQTSDQTSENSGSFWDWVKSLFNF